MEAIIQPLQIIDSIQRIRARIRSPHDAIESDIDRGLLFYDNAFRRALERFAGNPSDAFALTYLRKACSTKRERLRRNQDLSENLSRWILAEDPQDGFIELWRSKDISMVELMTACSIDRKCNLMGSLMTKAICESPERLILEMQNMEPEQWPHAATQIIARLSFDSIGALCVTIHETCGLLSLPFRRDLYRSIETFAMSSGITGDAFEALGLPENVRKEIRRILR